MEETMIERKQIGLINELTQGKELAKQLCNHLFSSSTSSRETNEFLLEKIIYSYEKALTMLNWGSNVEGTKTKSGNMVDSHCSFTNGSPRSEVIDHEFRHKAAFKKRKTMPRWTKRVKVCLRTGLEGSLDDGYSWRKYGQKDILGAKFPRGYYRCTHRNVQGCLATKQVQRSDEDPTTIEVTYRGRHTCTQAKHVNKAFPSKIEMGLEDLKTEPQEEKMVEAQPQKANFTCEAELQDKTEELDNKEEIFPWICFPSSSIGSENEDNNNILSESMMESFSTAFISPATSESNLYCLGDAGSVQHVQNSESDVTEIISFTNPPLLDLDILLDNGDFDTEFPFNTPEHFSS